MKTENLHLQWILHSYVKYPDGNGIFKEKSCIELENPIEHPITMIFNGTHTVMETENNLFSLIYWEHKIWRCGDVP